MEKKKLTQEQIQKLKSPLPKEAVKPHPTKNYLSSIKAIYVVERLNDVFSLGGWFAKNEIIKQEGKMVIIKSTFEAPEYGIVIPDIFGGNDNTDLGDAYKGACTDALTKIGSYLYIGMHAPGDRALEQRAWGSWFGREEAYFVAAAELVTPMSWAEVVAIGGRELSELGPALRGAVTRFAAMAPPARVQRGGDVLYRLGRSGHTVLQHSSVPFDVLEVPTPVADRLQKLQPGPLAELVSELGLDEELVRRLLDWQVLMPAP